MKYLYYILFALFISSCQANQKVKISSPAIPLVAEGPVFEGSNTAVGTWRVVLKDWLKEQNIAYDEIKNITIVSVKHEAKQALKSEIIQEITLQTTSKTFDMQKVAFINPYPKTEKLIALQVAKEQNNLVKLFESQEITFVADLNINKDLEENLNMEIIVEFEIEYTLK